MVVIVVVVVYLVREELLTSVQVPYYQINNLDPLFYK